MSKNMFIYWPTERAQRHVHRTICNAFCIVYSSRQRRAAVLSGGVSFRRAAPALHLRLFALLPSAAPGIGSLRATCFEVLDMDESSHFVPELWSRSLDKPQVAMGSGSSAQKYHLTTAQVRFARVARISRSWTWVAWRGEIDIEISDGVESREFIHQISTDI